ncbi:MAG: T9SS type A sorting domain-containing protein, partial [Cyclobacteriaceae bacterium]|nr:T9SS type A sorting domain-containing protein [Cyclobacteriaceae bacterium]
TTTYMKVQLKTGAPEGTLQYPYLALWATNGTTELTSVNRNGQYTDLEIDYYGLTPGVVYYISVDNLTGTGYRGTFKLCLSDVVDYNFYEGAIELTDLNNWCSADAAYTTVDATADKNKGAAWDSGPNYNRWFKFTALTASVTIQLRTGAPEGNLQYPYLALWAANGTTGLASVNRAGQYNDLTINYASLVIGSVYYISVDNLTGTGYRGTFKLCINNVDPTSYYSRGSGDWNDPNTWSNITYGGTAATTTPGAGNVVYIRDNAITVTSPALAAEVNLTTSASNTSLTIDNAPLTVNGRFIQTNSTNNSILTTVQNNGVLSVANNLLVTRSGGNSDTQINIPSGSVTVGQDMIWTSSSGTVANNTMTLSNSSSLAIGRDLTLSYSGGMKIGFTFNNNSTLSIGRDMTFTSSAASRTEAIFNNTSAMSIKRNIVRGGTPYGVLSFNNTSTLNFNGTANQQVIPASAGSGGDAISYNQVVFNNTSGFAIDFTLGGIVSIPGSITLSQGVLQTTSVNYLALLNGATSSLGSTNSFVSGPMTMDLASNVPGTTLIFPLGKSGSYRPVVLSISHSDNAAVTYTAEHFASSAGALGYTLPGTIERVSGVRYWTINRSAVANLMGATVTLYYGIGTSDGVTDPANLRVVKTNGAGTVWFDVGGTGSSAGTGTITSDPFTTFSVITLGNATGGTNPLPIQLISFEAKPVANQVQLKWMTASELNNDYFSVERSRDGKEFAELYRMAGKGTIQTESSYQFIDSEPFAGKSYYRLKQTDFDKNFSYSKIVMVELQPGQNPRVNVYPNPVTTQNILIRLEGYNPNEEVKLKLIDTMGREMATQTEVTNDSGNKEIEVDRSGLSSGMYIIAVYRGWSNVVSRVLIK